MNTLAAVILLAAYALIALAIADHMLQRHYRRRTLIRRRIRAYNAHRSQ